MIEIYQGTKMSEHWSTQFQKMSQKHQKMDPRNDILNNAINEDGVVIVDVRSPGKYRGLFRSIWI